MISKDSVEATLAGLEEAVLLAVGAIPADEDQQSLDGAVAFESDVSDACGMSPFPHDDDVRLTAIAPQSSRSSKRRIRGNGAGEREFYGGLAALTICSAIAMMRSGPETGFAATSASPIDESTRNIAAKPQASECVEAGSEYALKSRSPK